MTNNRRKKLLKNGRILAFMKADRLEKEKYAIAPKPPKPKYVLKNGEVVKRQKGRPRKDDVLIGDDGVIYESSPLPKNNFNNGKQLIEPVCFGNATDKLEKLQEEEKLATLRELQSKKSHKDEEINENAKSVESEQQRPLSAEEIERANANAKTLLQTQFTGEEQIYNKYPYDKPARKSKNNASKKKEPSEEEIMSDPNVHVVTMDLKGRLYFDETGTKKNYIPQFIRQKLAIELPEYLKAYDLIFSTQITVGITHPEEEGLLDRLENKIRDICNRKLTCDDLRKLILHSGHEHQMFVNAYNQAPFIRLNGVLHKIINPFVRVKIDSRKELKELLIDILYNMIKEINAEEQKKVKYYFNEENKESKLFRVFPKKKFR